FWHRVYFLFQISNPTENADTAYFFPAAAIKRMSIYQLDGNEIVPYPTQDWLQGYEPITLAPHETKALLVSIKYYRTSIKKLKPQLITRQYFPDYRKLQQSRDESIYVSGYVISGILLLMIFFSLGSYFLNKKAEFLYYSFYAGLIFILVFISNYTDLKFGTASTIFNGGLDLVCLTTGHIFYIAFTRKFLSTQETYPTLNRIFIFAERVLLVELITYISLHIFTDNEDICYAMENFIKAGFMVLGLVYVIAAMLKKDKLLNYLAAGNLALFIFSSLSYFFILHRAKEISLLTAPIFYYETGIVLELIFFLLGLAFKTRIDLIARTKEQEALLLEAERSEIEKQFAILNAQQQERTRISEDIHDELGAGVTAIRLYSELLKSKLAENTPNELLKISSSADELLNNLNAIIWTMSSANDSLDNMVAYIRSYIQEYFENTGILCKISIDTVLPAIPVSGEARRNIYMVIKETTSNILKHSKATEVTVTLKREAKDLVLEIHDNGIGIDFNNIRQFGNGLKNMKKRMDTINVTFTIENKNGTLITLRHQLNN
ncbi:MAG: hypothetical protein RLY16_1680, partial [Bacteroidota bacterium]